MRSIRLAFPDENPFTHSISVIKLLEVYLQLCPGSLCTSDGPYLVSFVTSFLTFYLFYPCE